MREEINRNETTMKSANKKSQFKKALKGFAGALDVGVSAADRQWAVKGFIDAFRNIYTISADTKIVSKVLEIHLFPKILEFATKSGYRIVLADHQNYYPDMTFVSLENESVKFAVDLKTTYRLPWNSEFCNGFTLGSYGTYFRKRDKQKNIQFPYNDYAGHFCLCAVYSRTDPGKIDETKTSSINKLESCVSVIKDVLFFAREKWEIASDTPGSGNTKNIGSIFSIKDLLKGNGVFKYLGEEWFDGYWKEYGKTRRYNGRQTTITKLRDYLEYWECNPDIAYPVKSKPTEPRQGVKLIKKAKPRKEASHE